MTIIRLNVFDTAVIIWVNVGVIQLYLSINTYIMKSVFNVVAGEV